jgi:hypothetical protein
MIVCLLIWLTGGIIEHRSLATAARITIVAIGIVYVILALLNFLRSVRSA